MDLLVSMYGELVATLAVGLMAMPLLKKTQIFEGAPSLGEQRLKKVYVFSDLQYVNPKSLPIFAKVDLGVMK